MTTQQDEQFSALVDGELDNTNSDIMLNRLRDDEPSRQRWYRYHLISDTLRAKLPEHIDPHFSQTIMAAIADEPAILALKHASSRSTGPTIKHRMAGFAIAASVAVVAVVGVRNLNEPEMPAQVAQMPSSSEFVRLPNQQPQIAQMAPQVVPQQMVTGTPAMNVSSTQTTLVPVDNTKAEFDPRLHQYIVNHNQHISGGQFQTIMPYVRIVVSPTIVHDQGQQ